MYMCTCMCTCAEPVAVLRSSPTIVVLPVCTGTVQVSTFEGNRILELWNLINRKYATFAFAYYDSNKISPLSY